MTEQTPKAAEGGKSPPAARRSRPDRTFTISFTLPKLVFGLAFCALTLTWVFIFGIMLGRGHKPEDKMPELARIMPSPFAANATQVPKPPAEVLRPEELSYHESLKGRTLASPVPKPAPPARPEQPKKEDKAASVRQEQAKKNDKTGSTRPQASPEARVQPNSAPAPAATAKADGSASRPPAQTGRFEYLYQVAAFKEGPPAEAMRATLQKSGLKPRVERTKEGSTIWYRVVVSFQGRPEETRRLRDTLQQNGISQMIMRSKKPAP
jgi:cell division protein FtsN